MRIVLAGAAGVVGRRLVPLLRDAGHTVTGTTRSAQKAGELRAAGAVPIVVDVYDKTALTAAVIAARPEIVIHQLTDLPQRLDPSRMAEATARNARVRSEGTRNLVAAAIAAGARRLIAQSIAWVYAPGPEPHSEDDPLDVAAAGARAVSIGGVVALETLTLASPPLEGIVLRYGRFYGPDTGVDAPGAAPSLHVDAAAWAALLAVEKARPGRYNVAETNSYAATDKAREDLGWDAGFRLKTRDRA